MYTGWWLTYPSEKYDFVSWDDYSQYMEKYRKYSKPPTSTYLVGHGKAYAPVWTNLHEHNVVMSYFCGAWGPGNHGKPQKIMGFGHVLSFFDHLPCSLLGHFLVTVWFFFVNFGCFSSQFHVFLSYLLP